MEKPTTYLGKLPTNTEVWNEAVNDGCIIAYAGTPEQPNSGTKRNSAIREAKHLKLNRNDFVMVFATAYTELGRGSPTFWAVAAAQMQNFHENTVVHGIVFGPKPAMEALHHSLLTEAA